MKTHHIRNIAFIFIALFTVMSLSSCREDTGSGFIFKMNIKNNPQNLDPQMATDTESVMVITNMMEGLMKIDASGSVVPAAAESFDMSEDGKTYTFHLRKNQKWESTMENFSETVKADDFVFAFHRMFDAETKSPHSSEYMCIKNASAVISGYLPVSELGIKAIDDYTVEFILEYPYYDFLCLLAQTPAMPCCRKFFALTMGKYGMAAHATASNGAFYLKEWNYDPYWNNNYLIMRRNKSYSESSFVYPYSVNLFITGDSSEDISAFKAGDVHCVFTDKYDEKFFEENNYQAGFTKTAGLLINTNSEYLGNKQIREALAKSINKESYSHILSEQFSPAHGIIPSGVTIQGKSYRDLSPDKALSVYDASSAKLWKKVLNEADITSVDGVKITVSENFGGIDAIYSITDSWRDDLLFYCGVETVSETEYGSKFENGDFSIALIEIGSNKNSPVEFLKCFEEQSVLTDNINKLKMARSLSESSELICSMEKDIIDEYVFIPLCYENEYLVSKKKSADLVYYPFSKTVWFGDAKYFD